MKKIFIIVLTLLIVLAGCYFLAPFVLNKAASFLIVRDELKPADVIVVLSGDDNGERVNQAVLLYEKKYAPKMLLSGGPLAWNLKYAYWMKKQANYLGVPDFAILIEDQSRSTIENARFCLPILKKTGAKKIILVTSPAHSRRAKRTFSKILSKDKIAAISFPAQKTSFNSDKWWQRHEDTQLVVWEYVSLVFYFLKGY